MKQIPNIPSNTEELREWLWRNHEAHYEPPANVDESAYLRERIAQEYNDYMNKKGVFVSAPLYIDGYDSLGFDLGLAAATCGNIEALGYALEHAPTEARNRRRWLVLTFLQLILDYPATIEFERDGLEPILDWFKENKKNLIWNTEVERFVLK